MCLSPPPKSVKSCWICLWTARRMSEFWGTGVFQKSIDAYLDFLFNEWGVTTLIGKTQCNNVRALGAMRKVGARVIEQNERNGHPEFVWTIERSSSE